jgi:hypothetical protein
MSSYLKIISSEEPIMPNLTGLALIKWVLSNVHEGEFGTCCDNKVYLNWSELPWSMYEKFKEAVYSLTKSEYRGTNVFIPTETMQTLWNEHTLSIEHERFGPFSKEQWVEYCKTVNFFVYVT